MALFLTMTGCGGKDAISPMTIYVNGAMDVVPSGLFIDKIDSIPIPDDDSCHLSMIEDVCVGDSSVYILDSSSKLIKINLSTGLVEKNISLRGHSESECIMPKSIAPASDGVFVLDMAGLKIVKFDENFNFVNSIHIHVPAMDFAAIPDGFLLFNPNASDETGIVCRINRDGKLGDNYIPTRGMPELIYSQHIFSETETGTLILPPMRNELYEYSFDSDSITWQYRYEISSVKPTQTGNEALHTLPDAAILAFESESFLITNYCSGQTTGTCVYDKKNHDTTSGLIKTGLPYPFSPMAIKDNVLYGLYEKDVTFKSEPRYIILKYLLKLSLIHI